MEPKKVKRESPEAKIQADIIKFLKIRDWYVKETHGNMFQWGFPDLFACHSKYGHRWIEVKNPKMYSFTPAQRECFPKFCANGSGVWIMVAATEYEYQKLFKPCNWYTYLEVMR